MVLDGFCIQRPCPTFALCSVLPLARCISEPAGSKGQFQAGWVIPQVLSIPPRGYSWCLSQQVVPLLLWTRPALSGPPNPPKKPPPGGRQVPLSPLEWELPCLLSGSLTGKTGLRAMAPNPNPRSTNAMILSCGCAASTYGDAQDSPRAILAAGHHML